MNRNEQKIFQLGLGVIEGRLTIAEFSLLVGKSYRQAQRILEKIRQKNMLGVKHGNLGRVPKNKTDSDVKTYILSLLRTRYADFNLTHFREKLLVEEGINIGRETLRKWAKEHCLVKRAKRRSFRKAHKPRPRMAQRGMLIQFDGSEHDWFSGAAPVCTLLGGIDDATSEIVGLHFAQAEDTFSCLKTVHDIVERFGVPHAFYVDQGRCFGKITRETTSTQLGRALDELGCRMIFASSPQAKGRIERLWNTLQDRLIAELRLRGIHQIKDANDFLISEFIPAHNLRFAQPPREATTSFKQLENTAHLKGIFCIKEVRKITAGNIFSLDQNHLVVEDKRDLRYRTITVRWHFDGSRDFEVHGKKVQVKMVKSKLDGTHLRKTAA